jgi:hypothetical protein
MEKRNIEPLLDIVGDELICTNVGSFHDISIEVNESMA